MGIPLLHVVRTDPKTVDLASAKGKAMEACIRKQGLDLGATTLYWDYPRAAGNDDPSVVLMHKYLQYLMHEVPLPPPQAARQEDEKLNVPAIRQPFNVPDE